MNVAVKSKKSKVLYCKEELWAHGNLETDGKGEETRKTARGRVVREEDKLAITCILSGPAGLAPF